MSVATSEEDVAPAKMTDICGIIMPISAMPPTYSAGHWTDVRRIIETAITKTGMHPQIVSDSFEGDVIQSRIINNLYYNPVVVCDVSGLNPNVMFELGMRITFKQPVIIVTDDLSSIPFDTKIIEHLHYPQDLHIHQTNDFIEKLALKIEFLRKQKVDKKFKSFIEEFGTFEILEPTKKVVPADKLILDKLVHLEHLVSRNFDYNDYNKRNTMATKNALIQERDRFDEAYDSIFSVINRAFMKLGGEGTVGLRPNSDGMIDLAITMTNGTANKEKIIRNDLPKHLPPSVAKMIGEIFFV